MADVETMNFIGCKKSKESTFGKETVAKMRVAFAGMSSFLLGMFGFSQFAFADGNNNLSTIITILRNGVCTIGGVCVIWGLVQLGLSLKDGTGGGGQLNGALAFMVGGAVIFAAGVALGAIDTSWIG